MKKLEREKRQMRWVGRINRKWRSKLKFWLQLRDLVKDRFPPNKLSMEKIFCLLSRKLTLLQPPVILTLGTQLLLEAENKMWLHRSTCGWHRMDCGEGCKRQRGGRLHWQRYGHYWWACWQRLIDSTDTCIQVTGEELLLFVINFLPSLSFLLYYGFSYFSFYFNKIFTPLLLSDFPSTFFFSMKLLIGLCMPGHCFSSFC